MTWSGKNHVISSSLSQDEVEAMLKHAEAEYTIKRIPKNGVLFWESEPHEYHYFLVEGTIAIYAFDRAGRKKLIDFYAPGSFIGYQFLRDNNMPMTTAQAQEDSLVISIPKKSFFLALHASPDFADAVVRYLFGLLSMQTQEVINASFYVASQRIPLLLLDLAQDVLLEKGETEEGIILPYGNNDIAEMLGMSRNSVTTSISRLQAQGVIEKHRNSIKIIDLTKLDEIAHLEQEG